MNEIVNFWNIILTQRSWSWSLAGIIFLGIFLLIKSFFMRGIIKHASSLNSKWYQEIKNVYIRRWQYAAGWILFLGSLLLVIFFWQTADFNKPSLYEVGIVFLLILALLFSVIFHLIAFAASMILVLKQVENNQMTL